MCPVLHLYVLFITDQYQKKYILVIKEKKENILFQEGNTVNIKLFFPVALKE